MSVIEQRKHEILHHTLTNIKFKCYNCLVSPMCDHDRRYIECLSDMGEWAYMTGFDHFCRLLCKYDATHFIKVIYTVDYSFIFDAAIDILTLELHTLLYDGRVIVFEFDNNAIFDATKAFFHDDYRNNVLRNMEKHCIFYDNLTAYHVDHPPELS